MKKSNEGKATKAKGLSPKSHHKRVSQACKKFTDPKKESFFNNIDKYYQANLGKVTLGISPAAIETAYFSWIAQLAQSPGTLLELSLYPLLHAHDFVSQLHCEELPKGGEDVRFHTDNWKKYPWRLWAEQFLQLEDWCTHAATNVPGLPKHVARTVSFHMRQILDAISPSNFVLTNPDLFQETILSGGKNLVRGTELAIQDMVEKMTESPPAGAENFIPGQQVAITKGKVIFSNHLIELIQYEPQTKKVYKEPILIIPAWIMKYYILDLLPKNSLVNWLTQQGHTVFIISWRNPDRSDRNLGMDDYYKMGAMAAINKVAKVIPNTQIHLMGYCLGGTLAMITASAMATNNDKRLKSLTLLAAQADFTEAGQLLLFITKSQVSFLKSMMWEQGYLDTKQMAGSFQMLRPYDLIWSKMVQDYMHGEQRGLIDLLAWNADATRMPYKMHGDYLEQLFLNNDFAEGRYVIDNQNIIAENIRLPSFVVSTEKDHVAPWKSVYKTHMLINGDMMFVLTNGGHNSGIVSEPGHKGHSFRFAERMKDSTNLSPKAWLKQASKQSGSWWPAWHEWLVKNSSPTLDKPPVLNASLPNAPGRYVLQK